MTRVRVLGSLEVEGVATAALGSRKQRSLLRVLAIGRGQPVSVDRIAECLWPERLPSRPHDQVGVLVSRLRSVLGADQVVRSDAGYALAADWIDVVALESLTSEAERRLASGQPALAATAAQAGLTLLRGPLLADEPDAPWADEARLGAGRTLARLQRVAAEAALNTDDPFAAATAALAALDEDPYDEHALRLLMTAHARAGRPASALGAYAETRSRLAEDLGASPAPATEDLHLAVLRGEIVPDAIVPVTAPTADAGLPGRRDAWRSLDRAYGRAASGVELVVVEGEAGIGKTRLLEAWSRSMEGEGVTVLWGACDPTGSPLPFQAVLDAVDRHLSRAVEVDAGRVLAAAGPVFGPLLSRWKGPPPAPPDPVTAQAALFAGALDAVSQAGHDGPPVLVLDDVHWADGSTRAWLAFALRRPGAGPLLIAAARRPDVDPPVNGGTTVRLAPLDLDASAEVVGSERAAALHARSGGHPLFLVELARSGDGELPASILEAVTARCRLTGEAEPTLRAAAILGPDVDLDLLAGVLRQPAVQLLAQLEVGERHLLLEERGAAFIFRHELVREALVAGTSASRRALVHREAARWMASRPHRDPVTVAWHARQGGDRPLAARALREAAAVASARFDHEEAERLLTDALALDETAEGYLARGRVRMTGEDFSGARRDAEAAAGLGAPAAGWELAGWAAYYERDFAGARLLAEQAEAVLSGAPAAVQAGVLALLGRIDHAGGDLARAGDHLEAAVSATPPGGAGVAGVWLGWLWTDRGDIDGAGPLIRRAEHDPGLGVHPFGPAHRALLAAYAAGLRGEVAQAFASLDEVDTEVARRHLDHFVGRSNNYRAWLLRNLLATAEADDLNASAAELAAGRALREPQAQAALDSADGRLRRGDLAEAAAGLEEAMRIGTGYAFEWKARMRGQLLAGRVALAAGQPEEALAISDRLAAEAAARGVPRHEILARLLGAEASYSQGYQPDGAVVEGWLARLDEVAVPEAWWVTAHLARASNVDRWWVSAEQRAERLAVRAGPWGEAFRGQAGRWLDKMRTARRRG